MSSRADAGAEPTLNLDDAARQRLLTYGLIVGDTPKRVQNWSAAFWEFPVYSRRTGAPVLWYLPKTNRYTYGWALTRLSDISPYYAKMWQRNGDQASFDLDRLTRDFDRLLASAPNPVRSEAIGEALDYHLNVTKRTAFYDGRKYVRPWSECLIIANYPADIKSAVLPLWNEAMPLDVLLMAIDGLNVSLLTDLSGQAGQG